MTNTNTPTLDRVAGPADLRAMSDAELGTVADELRGEVVRAVSQTGGHLGSSLGVVELSVAIHAVFDTPRDKLVWDVGHQCYPHKILTGRRARMSGLRQGGGISGFTKRSESEYDPFGAAHSSTSISAALGFTVGRDMGKPTGDAIAVIGDGSISAGMAYEALNNAGHEGRRMFVILNDNEMSIAPPVGAMSSYLSSLSGLSRKGPFGGLVAMVEGMEQMAPKPVRDGARRARELVTGLESRGTFFEELGFDYIGPIDGHDMTQLLSVLRGAKARATGPVLIHCCTVKGKGYSHAEGSDDKYHGVSKFDVGTGVQAKAKANAPSYTGVFGDALTREAAEDPSIVAITAAMPSGTGVDRMAKQFPGRVFDVGIAEQHGVTFAAGMAASGLEPFCAIYSTFLQRGYDQLIHDVALQNLPVLFAIDRAGLVGGDGATHQGSYDICFMRCLPNMTIMAPADEDECRQMLYTGLQLEGPAAVRYPRGSGPGVLPEQEMRALPVGKAQLRRKGNGIALLAFGAMVGAAESIGARLDASVVNMRFVKPLDVDMVMRMADTHDALVTIEDGVVAGGAGGAIIECLAEQGKLIPVLNIGIGDRIIEHGSRGDNLADAGLDEESLYRTIDNWRPSVPAAAPGGIV